MATEQSWVADVAGNVTPKPKRSFFTRLKAVRWGEGLLWVLLALSVIGMADRPDPEFMAGLFALVVIGVRATRAPREDK